MAIDLGEDHGATSPAADRPRRPRRAHRLRWSWLVATVVAALALPSTATVPSDPLPRLFTIAAAGNGYMAVAGDALYVADTRGGRAALTAYARAGGSRLWSVPVDVPLELDWQLALLGDTLIVAGRIYNHTDQSEAFDATTGRRLWGSTREVLATAPGEHLVLLTDVTRQAVYAVDERTGATRWTGRVGDCGFFWDDYDDPRALIVYCGDGRLRYVDLATGATTGTATVDTGGAGGGGFPVGDPSSVQVGGVVVVAHEASEGAAISAFRAGDLASLWHAVLIEPGAFVYACDDRLCVAAARDVRVYDPLTGALVGTRPLDAGPLDRDDTDWLLRDGPRRAPAVVVTPWRADGSTLVTSATDVAVPATPDRGVVRIPGFGGVTPTWVVRAVPRAAPPGGYRLHPLGVLDDVTAAGCVAFTDMLACATSTNHVTFWYLPSP